MPILLPIAGITANFIGVMMIGVVIGLLSGLLGVGGGFLLTPILMMIGVPPTVAAASGTNAIVATSSSGVAAHFRLRNVDLRMGAILLSGGLAGSGVGVHFVRVLRSMGNADFVIELTYVLMLGLVGGYIVRDSWRKILQGQVANPRHSRSRSRGLLSSLPIQMEFPHSGVRHSVFLPFVLCFLVGLLTAVMGVAGGFILVPMMVYMLSMPAHVAVGTSLFQALFTCAGATLMQAGSNRTVDLVLAMIVAVGSTFGAQIGARLSRHLRGEQLMILLGILALAVMFKMVVGLIVPPSIPISEIAALNFLPPIQHVDAGFVLHFGRCFMG
ncbi:MAG: sulfite exporter TauE/SafE family protein [Acidobacteriota bacterium]|nr:sulfite exporter TauE/SafE family protein [Acidobacteriota bacterium]